MVSLKSTTGIGMSSSEELHDKDNKPRYDVTKDLWVICIRRLIAMSIIIRTVRNGNKISCPVISIGVYVICCSNPCNQQPYTVIHYNVYNGVLNQSSPKRKLISSCFASVDIASISPFRFGSFSIKLAITINRNELIHFIASASTQCYQCF